MKRLLIKNGRLVDPTQSLDKIAHLVITEDKITDILFSDVLSETSFDQVIDATGLVVAPGLIDMHVHLRDPGQLHKEDIKSGTHAAVAGGFTSVLAMPNTTPTNDSVETTQYIVQKAKSQGHCKVYPVGALTHGLKSETLTDMEALQKAGCIAFSDDGRPCFNTHLFREAMQNAKKHNALVIEHCEDIHLTEGRATIHEGTVAESLKLQGISSLSESRDVARSIVLAMETKVKLHLAHISCADSMDLIRSIKQKTDLVSCEVSPHHLTLTSETILKHGTNAKMYPPLRAPKDIEVLQKALAENVIDAIATDHAPHAESEKNVDFAKAPNGVIGLQTALPVMLTLVQRGVLSLMNLITVMSSRPAEVLGLKAGSLKKGYPADVVIFSTDVVYDLGDIKQYSKSTNSPYQGFMGRGDVAWTLVNGKVVYSRGVAA